MIDASSLEPICYMLKASLDVCKHFCLNYVPRCCPEKTHESGPQDDIIDKERCGPRWRWCIVIDDEALESLEKAPEPIGDTSTERRSPFPSSIQCLQRICQTAICGLYDIRETCTA
ncbi:hypothetical protein Ptr902_11666 [Pyrenophora tritici-repentis]|nr:hypothetical protein Ptr902_11666 [Pyrenophora tritici-repentis]